MKTPKTETELRNEDPLTGAPGAHPAAAGTGAILGGPVGAAAGASMVAGAVAGGLIGKMTGEAIDPTIEDAYWRERHPFETHAEGRPYEEFEPAYRSGYEGFSRHGGEKFSDVEADIQKDYESHKATVPWDKARPASAAAWRRVYERHAAHTDRE
jgi:hypothetical protein